MNIFYKLKKVVMSIFKPQKQLTEGEKQENNEVRVNKYIRSISADFGLLLINIFYL